MARGLEFFKNLYRNFINRNNPIIKENTFLLWEPCSKSHSEVLPGYAKYLLDLGYHVSVLTTPQNIKDGLFSRFQNENLTINKISQKNIKKYFKKNDLSNVKGLLTTTIGKLCDSINYEDAYQAFSSNVDRTKLFFVEHEIKHSVDAGKWNEKIITLRKMDYKSANSVVVNPHYFGNIEITPKNSDITNFVTIGALRGKRKNASIIVDAIEELFSRGIENFKVTVIGKGKISDLPKNLHKYVDMKGRLPFDKMFAEIEKADFILNAYDEDNEAHKRYITTGTSGNFQLVYGFLKPCILLESFAQINDFNQENSILYKTKNDYADAMQRAIEMDNEDYAKMQNSLRSTVERIYNESKTNLERLING